MADRMGVDGQDFERMIGWVGDWAGEQSIERMDVDR
jgi:hypothetical protein